MMFLIPFNSYTLMLGWWKGCSNPFCCWYTLTLYDNLLPLPWHVHLIFRHFFVYWAGRGSFFSPLQSQKGFRKYNCAHKVNQNIAGTCCVLCAQPSESSELEHYKIINLLFSASATACNHLIFISAMKTLLFSLVLNTRFEAKKIFR